ncbi:hypothetical protein HY095_04475 [Candidatus Micrarchaeota archaeon]|nr:hypothetical protein [Candidatus Micrarchaeota archaeon]
MKPGSLAIFIPALLLLVATASVPFPIMPFVSGQQDGAATQVVAPAGEFVGLGGGSRLVLLGVSSGGSKAYVQLVSKTHSSTSTSLAALSQGDSAFVSNSIRITYAGPSPTDAQSAVFSVASASSSISPSSTPPAGLSIGDARIAVRAWFDSQRPENFRADGLRTEVNEAACIDVEGDCYFASRYGSVKYPANPSPQSANADFGSPTFVRARVVEITASGKTPGLIVSEWSSN